MEKPLITQLEELYVELSTNESRFTIIKMKIESVLKAFYESQEEVVPVPVIEIEAPTFNPDPKIQSLLAGKGFEPEISFGGLHHLKKYSVIKITHSDESKIEYEKIASKDTKKYSVLLKNTSQIMEVGKAYMIHESDATAALRIIDWAQELKNPVSIAKTLAKPFAIAFQNKVKY